MLFFNSLNSVIYLKSKSLQIYTDKALLEIPFPSEIVKDQEIIDQKSLEELIIASISENKLSPKKSVLVLSDEVYYQKKLPKTDKEAEESETNKFLDKLPFERPNLSIKKITSATEIILFASSKPFYYPIVNLFLSLGWKIEGVVPVEIYGIGNKPNLEGEDVANILKNTGQSQAIVNFLSDEMMEDSDLIKEKKGGWKAKFIILLVLVLLLGLGGLFFYRTNLSHGNKLEYLSWVKRNLLGLNQNNVSPDLQTTLKEELAKEATTSSDATASATKESTTSGEITGEFSKKNAKVRILNGTGVEGQAGKARDKLLGLNFENIELDNAEGADSSDTVVVYAPLVPKEIREDIEASLGEVFAKVSSQESSSLEVDILVTTGNEK